MVILNNQPGIPKQAIECQKIRSTRVKSQIILVSGESIFIAAEKPDRTYLINFLNVLLSLPDSFMHQPLLTFLFASPNRKVTKEKGET
ncbi:hypothetical protein DQQ10_11000 [Pseudochryseolinea flava]|uniref:Uncharacterized protein n=1 Tax=Pseudochryseolinea flava TaxID=2059302 RepID=A0A364Y5T5_9BACT|nr:hypothetical protein DQQ10_11000 [Pseudochryseolinea flava]